MVWRGSGRGGLWGLGKEKNIRPEQGKGLEASVLGTEVSSGAVAKKVREAAGLGLLQVYCSRAERRRHEKARPSQHPKAVQNLPRCSAVDFSPQELSEGWPNVH